MCVSDSQIADRAWERSSSRSSRSSRPRASLSRLSPDPQLFPDRRRERLGGARHRIVEQGLCPSGDGEGLITCTFLNTSRASFFPPLTLKLKRPPNRSSLKRARAVL